MKNMIALFVVALVVIGIVSCSNTANVNTLRQTKIKTKINQQHSNIFILSATAELIENDNWKFCVELDNLKTSDIHKVVLIDEPFDLSLSDGNRKCSVIWEVPMERWLDKKAFSILIGLNTDMDNSILITVKHPARHEKISKPTEIAVTTIGRIIGGIFNP